MGLNTRFFQMFRSWGIRSLLFTAALASTAAASEAENALFGYPHMQQSPFTLRAGRLVLGTDAALGITDFLQVGTSLVYNFYKVFNANAKVSLFDREDFALGLTLGWQTYNYQDISPGNPDLQIRSLLPGVTSAFAILEDVAIFVGGNLNYTSIELKTSGIESSGYTQGARIGTDISWAYNPRKKKMGNVAAAGITYDLTYQIFGFGLSHYWPGFHLGIHYYPNASQYRVQPIIAGGTAINF